MTGPSEEVYLAAAAGYARPTNGQFGNTPVPAGLAAFAAAPTFRAAVDAVWTLAVAEGRRQAAEAGMCGDRAPTLIALADDYRIDPPRLVCDLTAGHAGWHGALTPGASLRTSWGGADG